jgi:hypothetical protein
MRRGAWPLAAMLAGLAASLAASSRADEPAPVFLKNERVAVQFDATGLAAVFDLATKRVVEVAGDSAALTVGGEKLAAPGLKLLERQQQRDSVTYRYEAGSRRLEVRYELQPGWHFVSKQLVLTLPAKDVCRVDSVEAFRGTLKTSVLREYRASHQSGGVFLRLGPADAAPAMGAMLVLQNPFLKWDRRGEEVAMSYVPDMEWRAEYGPFASDRVCLGLYALSGVELPARGMPEWKYTRDPQRAFEGQPMLDWAEFGALSKCVEAFQLFRPQKSVKIHVPWCENDYQIDIATPEGRAEWKRIIDQAAAVGCDHTLFTPANGAIAPLKDNADAWGWECCLWLGLGQKIRKSEWDIEKDPIPASVQEMLD